jgi:methionyl-tRNA formyltransferase
MGGNQAGIVGALTVLSAGNKICSAISYSEELTRILASLGIETESSIFEKRFVEALGNADILICVHGRELVPPDLIVLPRLGGINVHPYLYQYKGANPVGRALKDKNFKASIGVHCMSKEVDEGEILIEEFVDVSGAKSVNEIYNKLYPYYSISLIKALGIISKK